MQEKKKICILGCGVAGISLAYNLSADESIEITVLEKEARAGGLHHSVEVDGLHYDIGTFVLHGDHPYFTLFPELRSVFVEAKHNPLSITPLGTIDKYPLSIRGYVRDNGILNSCYAGCDLIYCKARHWNKKDLASHIKYYLGGTIYLRSGLKNYIERLYMTDDKNIDTEFARQRLSALRNQCSLRGVLKKSFLKVTGRKSNVRYFVRPRTGFGTVYQTIMKRLQERKISITLGCEISKISRQGGKFRVECSQGAKEFDNIISTIPIQDIAKYLGLSIDYEPEYMQLYSLFYRFRGNLGHDATYLFNYTLNGMWKRATIFSRYYGEEENDHFFTVEGTLRDHPEENESEFLLSRSLDFENHVAQYGLFSGDLKYQGGMLTRNAYPLYRNRKLSALTSVKREVENAGIMLVGRQGRFDYLTSADTANRAIQAAVDLRDN